MGGLISTASSSFLATVGFDLSDVTEFVADRIVEVLGFGLYIVSTNLTLILVIAAISLTVYLVYRAFRWLGIVR